MSDFTVEIEREEDGRWIGEVTDLPGVLAYGATRDEAVAKPTALAFRVLADRLQHGEQIPEIRRVFFAVHDLVCGQGDRILAALLRIGWSIKRQSGTSHRRLQRTGWPDFVFAFHEHDEIGPRMPARIAKRTRLTPNDL